MPDHHCDPHDEADHGEPEPSDEPNWDALAEAHDLPEHY